MDSYGDDRPHTWSLTKVADQERKVEDQELPAASVQYLLRPPERPPYPPRRCWKQSEQYTGLSELGWKGT